MVCDWGMSPLGPIAFGDNQDTVFLGPRDHPDGERLGGDRAPDRRGDPPHHHRAVRPRPAGHRGAPRRALDKIAEALLEYETIEGKHVLEILQFGEMRSPVTA